MSYVIDRPIMRFVTEERDRCRALIVALRREPDYLLYCIDNAICADEIDAHRTRFAEFQSDDVEDLM